MAEEELLPFDPSMKKKKKKKKTGFDPDAQEGGDSVTDGTPKQEEPTVEEAPAEEQTHDKPPDDDFSLDFGGLKKKKKKKRQPFEMEEMKEALPATEVVVEGEEQDGGAEPEPEPMMTTDLSLPTKKKKKAKIVDFDALTMDEPDIIDDDLDIKKRLGTPQKGKEWYGSDRDYSYDELLTRVFGIIREKHPEIVDGKNKKFVMRPPQVLRAGARRTSFVNFAEISKLLHRQAKHVLTFLLAELGTSGSVDGNNQLIIKGRFNQKQIENVLRRYIMEYVTCHTCKSPDTLLQKEERLFFLQCESCGSRCSVASIKSGFQAVTGKRAAMRANAK